MELNFLETLTYIFTNQLTKYNSQLSEKRYLFLNDPEKIDENIQQLPTQIRNKIYIMSMRNYWRKYIPLTAQVPSWYKHAISQKKMLFDAMQENIHFMHLPCNTLEENKKYILGCQCSFCIHYGLDRGHDGTKSENEYKHRISMEKEYTINSDYFSNTMPDEGGVSWWNSRWKWICNFNDNGDIDHITMGMKIYNPGEDLYTTLKDVINDKPIYFT